MYELIFIWRFLVAFVVLNLLYKYYLTIALLAIGTPMLIGGALFEGIKTVISNSKRSHKAWRC
jgi:hypothetical protein